MNRWPARSFCFPFLLLILAMSGCATIISGSYQDVPLNVRPHGTIVCVDGIEVGTTPMIAQLSRDRSHVILLEKEGYEPAVATVPRGVNPWIVGNFVPLIVIPGPIGLLVDVMTGAVNQLEPGPTYFALEPDTSSVPRPARQVCSPL